MNDKPDSERFPREFSPGSVIRTPRENVWPS
jgi:hypothetical protein